jgi:DNA-binding GntR family transcriptional regulator
MGRLILINKKNYSEQIYEAIKADILTRKIAVGEKLTNRELQSRFGVSSTPVRDAINRLCSDGLLEDKTSGGARVISFDIQKALEVNEIVAMLNKNAVELTVIKHNEEKVLEHLSHIIAKQREYIEQPEYLEYDKQFHHTFFDYSGNDLLVKVYDEQNALWDMLILMYHHKNTEPTREKAVAQHQQIYDTYRDGNYQEAQRLAAAHFLDAVAPLYRRLAAQ